MDGGDRSTGLAQQIRNSSKHKDLSDFKIYGPSNLKKAYNNTVSFHRAQLRDHAREDEFIKALIETRVMENVEAVSMVGNTVQVTLKTLESKQNLMKNGLPFHGGRIIFRDPAILVFSMTMIDCPPCYKIRDLIEFMGQFGTVHQGYEVSKTVENVSFKNGNRVFQFSELNDLPPKRFKIDGHPVHLVYSNPDPSLLSENLVERMSVWGAPTGTGDWAEGELVIPETPPSQQPQPPQPTQSPQPCLLYTSPSPRDS